MYRYLNLILLLISLSTHAQSPTSWKVLDDKGTQLWNEQKYDEGLEVYIQAVAAAKKEFGINHVTYASTVQSLAMLQLYTRHLEESEKSFLEALAIRSKLVGKNNSEYEEYLKGIISLYMTMGNSAQEMKYYEEYRAVAKQVHGPTSDEYLDVLKEVGEAYMDKGDVADAEKLLLEGKGLTMTKPKRYGDFCTRLFQLHAEHDDAVKAEPFYKEAKRVRNKSQEEFWKTLNFKTMTYSYQIDDQDARVAYWKDQVKALKEEDPEAIEYARALLNLALIYETQEDYALAEPALMEAKTIISKNGAPYDYGTLYNSLAYFYDNMGNMPLALEYYKDEMRTTRSVLGRDHINYGTACSNQSTYYLSHGDPKKSELLAKTAALVFAGLNEGYTYYGAACMGLSQVYDKQGNLAKAEAYEQEAAKIYRMAFGEDNYIYAPIAYGLGMIYEKQKRTAEAEALIVHAKGIEEKTFGKDHIQYAGYAYELGRYYTRQKQYAKAAPLFHEAASIKLSRVRDNFNNLSEKEKKDLYRSGDYYFENYAYCLLKLSEKDKTIAGDLYDLVIDTKGLIYQSSAKMRTRILASGNKELIQSFHDWTGKREDLAKAYSMALTERKTKGIDLEKLEAEVNALEKNLARQASALNIAGLEEKKDIDWRQIKSKLQPGEAAIEIVRASRDGIREEAVYGALILTGGEQTQPELVILGSGPPLETKSISYYNNSIRLKLNDTLSYRSFWKPLAAKLNGVKKIYFSPSGVYHQVSIASLKNPATGKFLMEEYDIRTVGNTKDILRTLKMSGQSNTTFLMGFPDYSGRDGNQPSTLADSTIMRRDWSGLTQEKGRFFDLNTGTVMPLPGTLAEVNAIDEMLKKKKIPVSMWIGKDATEERLKKIDEPAVLHIATHGFFLPNQYVAEQDEAAKKAKQDPMLRSGLLLADCENALRGTPENSKEDGILSAYEAMNLSLDHTDLVVLSACETGVGEIDNSEGVYGLLRAFQQAGARFILVSLWKVDDDATQLLMTTFYKLQLEGLDYSQAFNKARQLVSEKYPEPYYWGAFVLIGV